MTPRALLLLVPFILQGQTPVAPAKPAAAKPKPAAAKTAPAKPAANSATAAEAALRARVGQFFQYHVDGNFRKAMEMVAEDTQDAYFAGAKQQLKSFEINSIKLTDNNTKAVVTTTVTRDWQLRTQTNEVVVPMITNWKIEKSQWVWYWDIKGAWLTPMGPSNVEPPTRNADGTINLPKNFDAEIIAAAARNILEQTTMDKHEVQLDPEKPTSTDQVTLKNGVQGVVKLALEGVPKIPGLTARLEKSEIAQGEQTHVVVTYQHPADAPIPDQFVIQLVTEPTNQSFPISVKFLKPDPPQ